MNQTYGLTWDLKRLGTLELINRSLSFRGSWVTQEQTFTLPAYYRDLDYITIEVNAAWTTSDESTEFDGGDLRVNFNSKSIEIPGEDPGDAKVTELQYANSSYYTINPWATGTLPFDPSLPWKDAGYSAAGKTMTGGVKVTINNPFKNDTKDTYLHGFMNSRAKIKDSETYVNQNFNFNIDSDVLTVRVYVPIGYSLGMYIKMTGHGIFDI